MMVGAKPEHVSDRAKERQRREMGTLGSGNHYLEVQAVAEIFDAAVARVFLLAQDDVCLLYTSPSPRDGLLSRMPSSA